MADETASFRDFETEFIGIIQPLPGKISDLSKGSIPPGACPPGRRTRGARNHALRPPASRLLSPSERAWALGSAPGPSPIAASTPMHPTPPLASGAEEAAATVRSIDKDIVRAKERVRASPPAAPPARPSASADCVIASNHARLRFEGGLHPGSRACGSPGALADAGSSVVGSPRLLPSRRHIVCAPFAHQRRVQLSDMDAEVRGMNPATRTALGAKIRTYRTTVSDIERDVNGLRDRTTRSALLAGGSRRDPADLTFGEGSMAQRERMAAANERMKGTSSALEQGRRILAETEEVGASRRTLCPATTRGREGTGGVGVGCCVQRFAGSLSVPWRAQR